MGEIRTKVTPASAANKRFHAEFAALLKTHFADEPAEVLLAVAAYTVGQLVALQDQRRFTPAMAMQVVAENIEAGNQHAIQASLGKTEGSA